MKIYIGILLALFLNESALLASGSFSIQPTDPPTQTANINQILQLSREIVSKLNKLQSINPSSLYSSTVKNRSNIHQQTSVMNDTAIGRLSYCPEEEECEILMAVMENKPNKMKKLLKTKTNAVILAHALWIAIYEDNSTANEEIIKLLLGAGASPNILPENPDAIIHELLISPLHMAVNLNRPNIVALLLAAQANPNWQDSLPQTPLACAAKNNFLDIARLLLNAGADPDITDNLRLTPLHHATERGYTEMVDILLKNYANRNLRDKYQLTPLDYATKKKLHAIIKLLTADEIPRPTQALTEETERELTAN